jgi:hypothetical protein
MGALIKLEYLNDKICIDNKPIKATPIREPYYIVASKLDTILNNEQFKKRIESGAPENANAFIMGMTCYIDNESFTPVQYYKILKK